MFSQRYVTDLCDRLIDALKMSFLSHARTRDITMCPLNLGGANAASDDFQNCQKKMRVSQGEKRWKAVRCSNR